MIYLLIAQKLKRLALQPEMAPVMQNTPSPERTAASSFGSHLEPAIAVGADVSEPAFTKVRMSPLWW